MSGARCPSGHLSFITHRDTRDQHLGGVARPDQTATGAVQALLDFIAWAVACHSASTSGTLNTHARVVSVHRIKLITQIRHGQNVRPTPRSMVKMPRMRGKKCPQHGRGNRLGFFQLKSGCLVRRFDDFWASSGSLRFTSQAKPCCPGTKPVRFHVPRNASRLLQRPGADQVWQARKALVMFVSRSTVLSASK